MKAPYPLHARRAKPTGCNIDATGRAVRLVGGLLTLAIDLVLISVLLLGLLSGPLVWLLALAATAGGGFMVYEGWAGWCVLRAVGVRTPL